MAGNTKLNEIAFREKVSVFDKLEKWYRDEDWFREMNSRNGKQRKDIVLDQQLKEAVGWNNQGEDGTKTDAKSTKLGMNRVGDTSAVIYLLENGATNDHVNKRGNTALHFAVRFGFDTIVNAILEKFPSELERKNIFGHTPLWIAFDTKNLKISRLLLPKSPENPVYHWLTSQGKVGDEGLELIKQHYDIKDVIKSDYAVIKDRGLAQDWRILAGMPKLSRYFKDKTELNPITKKMYKPTKLNLEAESKTQLTTTNFLHRKEQIKKQPATQATKVVKKVPEKVSKESQKVISKLPTKIGQKPKVPPTKQEPQKVAPKIGQKSKLTKKLAKTESSDSSFHSEKSVSDRSQNSIEKTARVNRPTANALNSPRKALNDKSNSQNTTLEENNMTPSTRKQPNMTPRGTKQSTPLREKPNNQSTEETSQNEILELSSKNSPRPKLNRSFIKRPGTSLADHENTDEDSSPRLGKILENQSPIATKIGRKKSEIDRVNRASMIATPKSRKSNEEIYNNTENELDRATPMHASQGSALPPIYMNDSGRFNGEVKLEEILYHFNILNTHQKFVDYNIDLDAFLLLKESDLDDLDFSLGPKVKILNAISELRRAGIAVFQQILKHRK